MCCETIELSVLCSSAQGLRFEAPARSSSGTVYTLSFLKADKPDEVCAKLKLVVPTFEASIEIVSNAK